MHLGTFPPHDLGMPYKQCTSGDLVHYVQKLIGEPHDLVKFNLK